MGICNGRSKRRGTFCALVELFQTGKLASHFGKMLASFGLASTKLLKSALGKINGTLRVLAALGRRGEFGIELLRTTPAVFERGRQIFHLLIELVETRCIHRILELRIRDRLFDLDVFKRRCIGGTLGIALIARERGDGNVELFTTRMELLGCRSSLVHILSRNMRCSAHLIKLGRNLFELVRNAFTLMFRRR